MSADTKPSFLAHAFIRSGDQLIPVTSKLIIGEEERDLPVPYLVTKGQVTPRAQESLKEFHASHANGTGLKEFTVVFRQAQGEIEIRKAIQPIQHEIVFSANGHAGQIR